MLHSPILLLHIFSGTLGIISGAAAIAFRKGSRGHGFVGNIFVVSMLTLGGSGIYLSFFKQQLGNVPGGALTVYLVATAWATARRKVAETGIFDWAALAGAVAVTAGTMTLGTQAAMSPTGMKLGYPPGLYFFLGTVAAIALVGDVRMLMRRGICGTQRLARHLWRMCFALFIASGSVFLARPHLFPAFMQKSGLLVFLTVLPLLLMIFWLVRVRFTNAYGRKRTAPASGTLSSASA